MLVLVLGRVCGIGIGCGIGLGSVLGVGCGSGCGVGIGKCGWGGVGSLKGSCGFMWGSGWKSVFMLFMLVFLRFCMCVIFGWLGEI